MNNLPANLPALKAGWSWIKLGDVCEINPKLNSTEIDDETEVSFLPMKAVEELTGKINLEDERKFVKVKKGYTYFGDGDVIFAKITPCMENGKVAITTKLKNGIGFGSTEFHVLRPNDKLLNKFLFNYLIQHSYRKLAQRNMTGTAGQLRVPKKFIENSEIPLPPLPEQKKIVEKIEELFSGLDSGAASLKKAKEQLRLYRQAVLAAAFSGRLVGVSKMSKVKSQTEMLKAAEPKVEYNNNGLPEGWKWVTTEEISTQITDGEHITPPRTDSGVYLLSARNVLNGELSFEKVDYVSEETYEKISKRIKIEEGDVLLSCSGSVGRTSVVPKGVKFTLVRSVAVIKPKNSLGKYISYALRSPLLQDQINTAKTQTAQANIFQKNIKKLRIPLAPQDQQNQIVSEIEKRFSVADNLEKAIDESLEKSEALRQSILKQAFEGRLV